MTKHLIGYSCIWPGHLHETASEAQDCINRSGWMQGFDERQRKEIAFSVLYARQFGHGTDGHNAKLIIARLVELLENAHTELESYRERDDC